MNTFKDRLEEALQISGKTAAELSRATKIPEGTISHYRAGLYEPKQKRLQLIAEALGVSIVFLLGVTNDPYATGAYNLSIHEAEGIAAPYLNLAKKAQDQNIAPEDVEKALEIVKLIKQNEGNQNK